MITTLGVMLAGVAIVGASWRFMYVQHLYAWERSRSRMHRDSELTAQVRAASARERLLREVKLATCEQQRARAVWGDPRDIETVSARKEAA